MFDGKYLDWNHKRIKAIIDNYGHPFFSGKKILDLGAGHGDIGAALYRLGADVTCVDAREEHLKVATRKYPGIKIFKTDLDTRWPFSHCDVILDLDLLNHIKDCKKHLQTICTLSNTIILETAVCDSNDPNMIKTGIENKSIYDWSFNGVTSYPTAEAIESILHDIGMEFKRLDHTKLNSGQMTYNWEVSNSGECNPNKRRLWFIRRIVVEKKPEPAPNPSKPIQSIATQPPANYVLNPSIVPVPFPSRILESIEQKRLWGEEQLRRQQASNSKSSTNQIIISPSITMKPRIRLFYNYYVDKNPVRRQEIDYCLQKNIDNPNFEIIIIESEQNPTFNFFFEKINLLANSEDISIICNSDIYFDTSIKQVDNIAHNTLYALSRWDWYPNRSLEFISPNTNQDTWIIRGNIDRVNGDFMLGKPGSNGRIAHEFDKAGYNIRNPSINIKAYHIHGSGIRNYNEEERIPGPYLNIEPTNI